MGRTIQTTLDRFLTVKEVCYVTSLGRTELLERRVPQGRFPKPIKIGKHKTARLVWRESQIKEWMEERERENPWTPPPANDNTPDEGDDAG
jgi:predicted DNA-binding transcriptional regulator AlpA